MKKSDLLWLLAYPIYQIIGTARHELSHALAAWLQGSEISKIVILPTIRDGGILWGYVRGSGETTWLVAAAPYLVDLLTFLIFFWICMKYTFKYRGVWINLVILGMLSPLINSLYNYYPSGAKLNDITKLFELLPPNIIHLYFWFTLSLYIAGLVVVCTSSKMANLPQEPQNNPMVSKETPPG